METLFKNNIDWTGIGVPQERCKIDVMNCIVVDHIKEAQFHLKSNFIIPFSNLWKIKEQIIADIEGLKSVRFSFQYNHILQEEPEIIRLYLPYIVEEMQDYGPLMRTIDLSQIKIKDDVLILPCIGEKAADFLNQKAAEAISALFNHNFGIKKHTLFQNQSDFYDDKVNEIERNNEEELAQLNRQIHEAVKLAKTNNAIEAGNYSGNIPGGRENSFGGRKDSDNRFPVNGGASFSSGNTDNGNGNRRKRGYEGPVTGNRILGKAITGKTVESYLEINSESVNVVAEGQVFKKESRELKNQRCLVTLLITDNQSSLCVKSFVSKQKMNEIEEHVKVGSYIKVEGEGQYDTFENCIVLMASGIEMSQKEERQDTCMEKRVELHAHTKMSRTDGLNDVKALVKTAIKWGHPAIAITDHGVVQSFPDAASAAKGKDGSNLIKVIFGMEGYLVDDEDSLERTGQIDYKKNPSRHVILLAKTQEGMKNLYRLVSYSHIDYFYKRPRIPKSMIQKYREGLLVGSACEAGEVFQAVYSNVAEEKIKEIIDFYDYLEIQPRSNNLFMIRKGMVEGEEELLELNRKIVELGKKYNKPVAATCDTHYLDPEDFIYRRIIMTAHGFHDTESEPTLYMRTTNEMLEEFSYLGEEDARWVVIQVPNQIAQQIGDLLPVPKERFPPEIPGSEERLRNRCYRTAKDRYGDPLPPEIQARLDRELNSIIGNGYAVMYVAAELVVQKSLDDGYLVGSRGSVGSSFAATMGGITEVNPLPAHYICPNSDCKHFEWGNLPDCDCGVDLPDKMCPECGTPYEKDGFNIPFEVFLGFKGDKEPDIDLNFAGEYQPTIHKYVEEIFGAENVFRAGTIGTIQGKTAEGYVRKFFEETGMPHSKWDIQRLAIGCNEVKKTTGQHPGGIVIVPKGHEIYEFCPVQHPANTKSDIITTHFDYHKIDQNLLKLDLLGHDAPSIIRMLEDMTGIGPDKIPLRDDRVNSLFLGTKALEIKIPDYKQTHGTFGIPEFGTKFTRQMLDDTKPTTFADLVRIAGFSHGTDVWLNNAQDLIRSGIATMKDAISTRDDIMNYLIAKGVPEQDSFKIMEAVRKGKGVTEDQAELMSENNVPDWYIESCRRIKYMFPKAHAVAYVMMSYRIAYFKVYHPQEFYAVYFTMHIDDFNCNVILGGIKDIVQQMQLIDSKGKEAQNKELSEYTVFEVAYEMYARGYSFVKASLGISDSKKFKVIDGKIVIPFQALEGVGETAAMRLTEAFEERPFISLEDVRVRAGINKSNIETLKEHGVLDSLPEANQITMF